MELVSVEAEVGLTAVEALPVTLVVTVALGDAEVANAQQVCVLGALGGLSDFGWSLPQKTIFPNSLTPKTLIRRIVIFPGFTNQTPLSLCLSQEET